jgi:uncharacterized cupin superfamily protein
MTDDSITFATINRDTTERSRQPLARELGVGSFGCNLLVLAPRMRGRIHAHEHQEEVFLVLEGELTLLVEGVEHVLGPDRLVRVGPAARRQLTNAGTERLVLLALGASGEHAGRDGLAWESWDDRSPGRPPLEIPTPDDLPA